MSDPLRGGPEPAGGDEEAAVLRELAALGVEARRVERPANEVEAQAVLDRAHREGMTVLPVGGGTGLGTGPLPDAVDLVLDTRGLDRILAFDPQNLNVALLGGMTVAALNAHLAGQGRGFFLPLDPPRADRATIGGVYASNASGPSRLLYGTVRDQALGVRGVDARGREIGFGGKTVKNVSGYDLTKFLIGSAGSLGLVTSISFRVLPLPEARSVCRLGFEDGDGLARFLSSLRGSVLIPSAVLVSDGNAGTRFSALVGFEGREGAVARQERDLLAMADSCGGTGKVSAGREAYEAAFRAAADPDGLPEDYVCLRVAAPLSRAPATYEAVRSLAVETGMAGWKAVLCAGSGTTTLYASKPGGDGARRLAAGLRRIAGDAAGHAAVVRASRDFLAAWGARVDPPLARWVLEPLKRELDPTAVFPPIL